MVFKEIASSDLIFRYKYWTKSSLCRTRQVGRIQSLHYPITELVAFDHFESKIVACI
ncbi:hypothetical protein V6Z11_D03G066300 [Gossypium hirsutum]